MTLFQKTFIELCASFGSAPFLDDDRVGVFSIEESYQISLRAAKDLQDAGFQSGDGIIVKASRDASTTLLFYATQILGLIALTIDPRQDAEALLKLDPRLKGIIYQDDPNDVCHWVIKAGEKECQMVVPSKYEGGFIEPEYRKDADAVWVLTSGSEGHFKVVRHCQEDLFSHCRRYHGPSSCHEYDRGIMLLPLYHVFGLALIYIPLVVGFSLYFPTSLDLDEIIDYTIKKKITYLDTVPSFHYVLAKRVQERGIHFTTLRNGLTAGAPMEESRFKEIEETLGMKLLPVYGASEIIGISGLGEEGSQERRRTTVGPLVPGTELRIVDDNGNILDAGQQGEIVVRSPSLMLGYLGEDSGIDEEGFFATGDIGYLDEIGDLHITGRKKQIIIRNGNNISASEVENRLLKIKGIEYCCVVGVPDSLAGEVPAAAIVKKEGTPASIIEEEIEKELPKNLWPGHILYLDALPALGSGKTDRVKVKEMLLEKIKG